MESMNLGLDSVSMYLKSEKKQTEKDRNFVNTTELETDPLKAPEFLENVYKSMNSKKNDSKKEEKSLEEANLLTDNKNKNIALANKNEKLASDARRVSDLSEDNLKKSSQIINEIYNQIKA